MAIRAIESVVRLSQVTVAQAIDFAVEQGAHVVTMSLGGIPSFALHRALTRAVFSDVIVLAAAGNCVGLVVWPARYDTCVAVAGTNSSDQPWRGTSRGPDVDIAAPGENVFRARVEKGKPPAVGQGQGTSFAVALTAGVAACWLAHHGRANLIAAARARGETLQAMFLRLVKATARRPSDWDGINMGSGIVHAERLLQADFDLGRDRESSAAVPTAQAPALSVRRFVAESVSPDAAQAVVDWNLHGPEIALSILNTRRGRAPSARGGPRPEVAPGEMAGISPTLARVIATNAALEAALGSPALAGDGHG
jgi:subtilisin family serine protease